MPQKHLDPDMLNDILHCVGEGIIYQRADGSITFFNQSAQRIFGIDQAEAKRRDYEHPEWHLVYEDGSPCPGLEHPSMVTLRTGQAMSGQIRGISRPGQPVVWLSINTRPIMSPGQELPEAVVISFNDVTDRKRAEEEFKESQARYRAIFETNQAPKLLLDPTDGSIVDANQAACQFYGYTLSEIRAKRITEINTLPPTVVKEEMEKAKLKDRLMFHFRHRLRSGEIRDVEVFSGPIDEQGRILLHSIVIDVTERKKAEEALRSSEEKYRHLVRFAPAGIYEIDLTDRRFLSVNDVMCDYTGYSREEFLALDPMQLLTKQSQTVLAERLAKIAAGQQVPGTVEFQFRKKDGELIWALLNVRIQRLESGRVVASVVAHNITARKGMEDELRASEERYRLIADRTSDSIWAMDAEFNFTYLSPSSERLFGYTAKEWDTLEWSAFVHPDYLETVLGVFEGLRQKPEKGAANAIVRVRHKDGRDMWLEFTATPITGPSGELIGVVGVTRDITSRKQAEEELRQSLQTAADLVSAIPSGLFIYQYEPPNSLILLTGNPEAQRLTGISEEEFRGREFDEIWPQAREARITDKFLEVMRTGETFETEDLHYQDQRLAGAYRIHAFALPGQRLAVAFDDITARKKAEARLIEQEKVLTDILEDTLSGYWDWNIPANTEYMSPAFKRMFGYEDHELPNSPEVWQRLIFPEDLPGVLEGFDRHVKSHGREPYYNEVRYRHKNGSTVWVICAGRVIEWDEDGSPIRMVGCHVDITEKKRTEETLRQSKALLETTGRMARVGGWELDAQTLMVNWTEETYRIHEVSLDHNPPLEEAINFWHPDDRGRLTQAIQLALEKGVPYDLELRFITAKGRHLWARTACRPEVVDGRTVRLRGTFQDITERKEAEKSLQESEERFRSFSEQSLVGIYLIKDGVFTYANPKFADIFGYSVQECLDNMHFSRLVHPEDLSLVSKQVRRRAAGKDDAVRYEFRGIRKDGHIVHVEIFGSAIIINGELLVSGTMLDITERKRAEEELRASEERFRQLYEKAPIAYQSLNPDGLILDVNQVWLDILGYKRDEVLGRWFGSFLQHDYVPHFEQNFPCFKDAGHITGVEFMMRKKDGSSVQVSFNGAIAHDTEGKMLRSHCVFQDITEPRRLEAQLRQAQKMEALGTLSGGIAHDFNNILGAVLGFAEIARDDAREGRVDPHDLDQIVASVQRAKDLVKQILTFSRKNEPSLQPVSFNQAVTRAQVILERTLPKMIAIETELAPQLPPVQADPTQIEQVLLNLASNAADAMPEGGRLVFATKALKIDEKFNRLHPEVPHGEYVLLTASDTGCGMDRETCEHIFEPFFTTKEVGKGTGLGLSTAYGIVKSHGGFIYCHSEIGKGTAFSIYFPVMGHERLDSQPEVMDDDRATPGGTETVLLVDDEEAIRAIAGRMLRGAGYLVLEASSGEEALKIYTEQPSPPDLVITDLGMPGMGGHKAMLELFTRYPGIKVVIASGYAAQTQVKTSLEAGAAAFVGKPFKKAELLATVRSLLDKMDC